MDAPKSTGAGMNGRVHHRGRRLAGVGIVGGAGVLFAVVEILHMTQMTEPIGLVLGAIVPFLLALVLVGSAIRLWTSEYENDEVFRVAIWAVVGMVVLVVIFGWIYAHEFLRNGPLAHGEFVFTNTLIVGAIVGLLVGHYDVRSRIHRRAAERDRSRLEAEQEKLSVLNHAIRHHVLNGMNVIQGRAALVSATVDEEERAHLETLLSRSEDIVHTVEHLRTITTTLTGSDRIELTARNLSTILSDQAAAIEEADDTVTITVDAPSDVHVLADASLETVVEYLMSSVAGRPLGDASRSKVDVIVTDGSDDVTVCVTATGGDAISPLDWRAGVETDAGSGFGLALVDTVVTRYGGEVVAENSGDSETTVTMTFPRATKQDAAIDAGSDADETVDSTTTDHRV